jgi:glycosyltransferase involved in cell wall biosynthesis
MKILFLTPWYPDDERPNSGIFIRAQAQALARHNQVLVIAVKVNYKKKALQSSTHQVSTEGNLEENRLEVLQSLPLYNQFNFLLTAYNFAIHKGLLFKPDIVHASIGYPGALLGWFLARKLKTPFVFTEHTRPRNNFRSAWHKFATRFAVARATTVLAVSHSLAQELEKEFRKEAQVIPNIVDIEKYKRVTPSHESEWQLGFIGGMNTPVKGLDILLNAASLITKSFTLHICGTGGLIDSYKQLAEQLGIGAKCKFYGFIDPSEMPCFFERLHVLVCSSRYETFNVSLIEAMACGIPVVSTRCGGPEDFVNETNGILCESENPLSLKNAIEKVMTNPEQFQQQKIREFAAMYRPEVIASHLLQVYKNAIAIN